jgi:hypothetical protein
MKLVDNSRTLTSSSISTKSFFTPRNFWILSRVAELAHEENDGALQTALLLMVTGSSAQASRLIPSRGKLSGGGQAWTIPGFWVPPIHLESNPFIHLRARMKKMDSALKAIQQAKGDLGAGSISKISAQQGLREIIETGRLVDLVFMDPPYGDSVAFLEFSAIWNSFLATPFKYGEDLSISNRLQDPTSINNYEEMLEEISELASAALKPEGKILLTFNNNDLDAWKAIVGSLQKAGFMAIHVAYQDPAVVSTKSQMSPEGSYVGDFYVVLVKSESRPIAFQEARLEFAALLENSARSRGGSIHKSLALRFALKRWLILNVDAAEISSLGLLINEIFVVSGKSLTLATFEELDKSIETRVLELSTGLHLQTPEDLDYFSRLLENELGDFGAPSIVEALAMVRAKMPSNQLW